MNAKKGIEYVLVRLKRATRDRLEKLRADLLVLVEQGHRNAPATQPEQINPRASELSMDALVNYLLDRVQAHRERARRSRKKKGGTGDAAIPS